MIACYRRYLGSLLLLLGTIASPAASLRAQSISGAFSIQRAPDSIGVLLKQLREDESLKDIPKYFFGDVYNEVLPNLVVFVDKAAVQNSLLSPIRAELILEGEKKKELYGESYLYCLLFVATDSEEDSCFSKVDTTTYKTTERKLKHSTVTKANTGGTTITHDTTLVQQEIKKPKIYIKLSPLDYSIGGGEFVLYRLVRGIAERFLPISGEEQTEQGQIADTTILLELEKMGHTPDGSDTTYLYYAYEKIPIGENTINRVGIRNVDKKSIYNTFGNFSDSKIATSIGLLRTSVGSEEAAKNSTHNKIIDPFVFGHWYLCKRPNKPAQHVNNWWKRCWSRISIGPVIGTKITNIDDLFDDYFVGWGIGHLVGSAGIVVGRTFRTTTNDDGSKSRDRFISIGLNIFL